MKKIFFYLIICGLTFNAVSAQKLSAIYDYASFYSPDEGPYVETYILFDASSLKFISNEESTYNASVEITLNLKRNDSTEFLKKYELRSPKINNPEENLFSFLDVQRFTARNGIYTLEISLKDVNSDDQIYTVSDKISIYYPTTQIAFSSIEFISEYKQTAEVNILSKSGYDMNPFIGNYFPKEIEKMTYYCEVYGIPKVLSDHEHYISFSYIEVAETGFKVDMFQRMKREKVADVSVLFNSFNIKQLPSGNYNLVIEIRNAQNQTVAYYKKYFQRSNPNIERVADSLLISGYNFATQIQNDSLLYEYIQALDVIASPNEQTFIRKDSEDASLAAKQQFLYRFWLERNLLSPESEWENFKQLYDIVAQNFSTLKRQGYKTDRGRIYLKYGPPSHIVDEKFKSSIITIEDGEGFGQSTKLTVVYLPYQIWRYDMLPNNENQRSLVFWVPQSAGMDYVLLHSNVRGEISDPRWELRLSRYQLPEDVVGEAGRQFERGY